jgi:hypothetical protein
MTTEHVRIEYTPKDLPQRFERYPKKFEAELMKTLEEVLEHAQDSVPPYPSPSGKKFKFVSDKQRRYVMWALREGKLKVPYKRRKSGGLGGSLTKGNPENIWYKRNIGGSNFEAAIGTQLPYAEHVIGQKQAAYHQGTWWTVKDWKKRAVPGINRIFEKLVGRLAGFLEGKGA